MLELNIAAFKALIKEKGLSWTKTAQLMEISRSHLWRVLEGESKPGQHFIAGFKMAFPDKQIENFFSLSVARK